MLAVLQWQSSGENASASVAWGSRRQRGLGIQVTGWAGGDQPWMVGTRVGLVASAYKCGVRNDEDIAQEDGVDEQADDHHLPWNFPRRQKGGSKGRPGEGEEGEDARTTRGAEVSLARV